MKLPKKPPRRRKSIHGKLSNSKLPSGRTKLSALPLSWTTSVSACRVKNSTLSATATKAYLKSSYLCLITSRWACKRQPKKKVLCSSWACKWFTSNSMNSSAPKTSRKYLPKLVATSTPRFTKLLAKKPASSWPRSQRWDRRRKNHPCGPQRIPHRRTPATPIQHHRRA